ncbi:IS3 family transposase [Paenibacillus pinihumi]
MQFYNYKRLQRKLNGLSPMEFRIKVGAVQFTVHGLLFSYGRA